MDADVCGMNVKILDFMACAVHCNLFTAVKSLSKVMFFEKLTF